VLSGEATNTNFIVFGMTGPGLKPTIYRSRGEHVDHYTTDGVQYLLAKEHNYIYLKACVAQ
jgi:hypothetical protein